MLYAMDGAVQADESEPEPEPETESESESEFAVMANQNVLDIIADENQSFELVNNLENMESSDAIVSADSALAPAINENHISGVSFEDVADYGNTASVTGVIQYDLKISEINTSEQRKIIQDSITDSRFKWNVDEVMSLMTKGQLLLKDLDPVTTHIIVQRIKDLKVEISWSQHVL